MLTVLIKTTPHLPGSSFFNAEVCTPADIVLMMFAGWLMCFLGFRIYKKANDAIQRYTKYELMQASIEVVRLCDAIQTCMPNFAVREIHGRRIMAAGMILALRDEGVPTGEYEIESVLQLAYGNGFNQIQEQLRKD